MRTALLTALVLALAPLAGAQSLATDAAPAYGTLQPSAEAASVDVVARATTPMPDALADDGCVGYVDPSAPDAVVEWGGGDLRVWVRAGFDPTLAVYGPEGDWTCNDDFEGLLPVVEIDDAPAGRYAVWLGAFGPSPDDDAATLYAGPPPPAPVLDASAAPLAGRIDAAGGFEAEQGAIEVAVMAGGPDAARAIEFDDPDLFCTGYVDADRPTAVVDYDAEGGTGTLSFSASDPAAVDFGEDFVMIVVGPDGAVACNDDYDGTDPRVSFDAAASGAYAVWVGTYRAAEGTADATLTVSETAPEVIYEDYDYGAPYSEGSYTPLDLDATPPVRFGSDGETATAEATVRPTGSNPVQGMSCAGYVEAGPTAGITLAGEGPFALRASSDADLTLTVRTPGGAWFCSDDADGLDPGIQIDEAEAGTYLAWVGTFSDDGSETEVTLSAGPGEVAYEDGGFGMGPELTPQSEGTYDGTELGGTAAVTLAVGDAADVTAGGPIANPVEGEVCTGFVSAAPTAAVEADGDVRIEATAAEGDDLTLVIRAPDGTWTCSDDADGRDPAAEVMGGPGTYEVWVGTFSRRSEPVPATLRVEG